jgi:protein-tyrosine-phosphatase
VKLRVLFLCATNSVQSPMAEALLNRVDSEHFEAISAGLDRGENHPLTVDVMQEVGVDLKGRASKTIHDFFGRSFDFVITLSDRARSECRGFPEADVVHWEFADPSRESDPEKRKRLFRSLRDQITQRVGLFALVQARFVPIDTDKPQANAVRF